MCVWSLIYVTLCKWQKRVGIIYDYGLGWMTQECREGWNISISKKKGGNFQCTPISSNLSYFMQNKVPNLKKNIRIKILILSSKLRFMRKLAGERIFCVIARHLYLNRSLNPSNILFFSAKRNIKFAKRHIQYSWAIGSQASSTAA